LNTERGRWVIGRVKKIWHDSVWSKIIAQGLFIGLGFIGSYLVGWWPKILEFFHQFVLLALSVSQVPNWLLLILFTATVLYIVKIGSAVIYRLTPKENENKLTPDSYTQDLIFDIFWRWTNVKGFFTNLKPYCPQCDYELSTKPYIGGFGTRTLFICDHCEHEVTQFEMSLDDISKKVYREIERKFRTGLWFTEQALPPTGLRNSG
jgi:hypothetical protein